MNEQKKQDDSHSFAWEDKSIARAETVRVLLEHGADVTAQDDAYSMPLHLASSEGAPDIARLLIEYGADINSLDGNRKTPLHLAASGVSAKKKTALSLQQRADVKEQNNDPIGYDMWKLDTKLETVQVLLEHDADVTARDDTHSTPLHLASSEGSLEITQLLVKYGAAINARDGNGKTPLHLVSEIVSA